MSDFTKIYTTQNYETLKNKSVREWSNRVDTIWQTKSLMEKHQLEINHDKKHDAPCDLILAGMIMMEEILLGDGTCSIDGYQMFVDGDYNNEMDIFPYNDAVDKVPMNDKQILSLEKKWLQSPDGQTWKQFRNSVVPSSDNSIVVRWCGMYLQIETDGYCHT